MAGTLSVSHIQGLATHSDPTTVSIASGHQLHQPGMGLQTQFARHTEKSIINSTSFQAIFTCSITPKFASSKILIQAQFSGSHRNYHSGLVRIYRNIGGTVTVQGGGLDTQDVGTQWSNVWFNIRKEHTDSTYNYSVHTYSGSHLDSPNTTSEIIYTMSGMTTGDTGTGYGLYVNRTGQNTQVYDSSCCCTLTLTEIAQ